MLLHDDNQSVYDQGDRVNSFNEEYKNDDMQSIHSMILDIEDDDFELEMERSISRKSSINMNAKQKDFKNWYNALKK